MKKLKLFLEKLVYIKTLFYICYINKIIIQTTKKIKIMDNLMKEYYLRIETNDGSLNNAYLSVFEGKKETVLIESIKQATKKGWISNKKIFEELEILQYETDKDLIISELSAMKLIEKYGNVEVKEYNPYYVPPPSAAHYIALFITKNGTDPYERF